MRIAFAHDALLEFEPGAELAAPGGAVTLELCGSVDHPPPCPLAPHHTRSVPRGDGVAVHVLFAAEPAAEAEVRARIDRALAAGACTAPDGTRSRWALRRSGAGAVSAAEREHAARLVAD